MRALVYDKPGRENGSIREIPVPECKSGQVLVKIMSCGICKPAERSHDLNGSVLGRYPAVPGHEMAGIIEKTGDKVRSLKPGMPVTIDNGVPCKTCSYCRKGEYAFCENFGSMGHNLQGGMAEYVVADEDKIYILPEGVSFDEAAVCELVGCALRAVERSRVSMGDHVLILGAGPSGNILTQLFLGSGASSVAVTDRVAGKLKILKEKGAVVYQAEEGQESRVFGKIEKDFPEGFDIIVDACGSPEFSRDALGSLKRGGTFVGYSFPNGELKELPLPVAQFIVNEWTYAGSTFNSEFETCLELIRSGKVDCKCLITGHYLLEQYFEALDINLRDSESLKIIIHPNGYTG